LVQRLGNMGQVYFHLKYYIHQPLNGLSAH
jgi:hypothetical protein